MRMRIQFQIFGRCAANKLAIDPWQALSTTVPAPMRLVPRVTLLPREQIFNRSFS
jgi:hypothetical protein